MKEIIESMIVRDFQRTFVRYYVLALLENPEISEAEFEKRFKWLIDHAPNDDLAFHYNWTIEDEIFEMTAYIVEVAKKRGVDIIKIT